MTNLISEMSHFLAANNIQFSRVCHLTNNSFLSNFSLVTLGIMYMVKYIKISNKSFKKTYLYIAIYIISLHLTCFVFCLLLILQVTRLLSGLAAWYIRKMKGQCYHRPLATTTTDIILSMHCYMFAIFAIHLVNLQLVSVIFRKLGLKKTYIKISKKASLLRRKFNRFVKCA